MDVENDVILLKLSRPYVFAGQTYTEINLTGIDKLMAGDMIDAENHVIREGLYTPTPEATLEYSFFIARKLSGQPIGFFMQFAPEDADHLRKMIKSFLCFEADKQEGG